MSKISRRGFVKGAALAPLALTDPFSKQDAAQSPAPTAKMDKFDIVVAGSGHNSLTTACYLAKAGFKVLVVEGRPIIGGGTKTAQLTLAGFHHDTCSCDHQTIQGNPMLRNNELHLEEYGLEYIYPDPVYHVPFKDGRSITQWQDFDRTCAEIAVFSKKDAETFRRITDVVEPIRKITEKNFFTPAGISKSTAELLAAHPQGRIWQRRMLNSAWNTWNQLFESPEVITFMMAPWPDNVMGPMSGMTAYSRANRNVSSPLPKGGSGMLAFALARYLEAHGGVILRNKPVVQLIIENGKCVGIECADGSQYRAEKAVLSTIHVKQLVEMAPKNLWGEEFLEGVEAFHIGPAGFNTHYALKSPLLYPKGNGTLSTVHSTTLSSPERGIRYEVELAVGDVDLTDPVLHIVQASSMDTTRAPQGMHTMRILARAPYNLKNGGWKKWDEIKEQVADAHLKAVQKLAHNFTDDMILGRFITTPVDIYQMNPHSFEGCCHGGTDGPSQAGVMRPVPGWAQHRMPIAGLYQTGGTTHPGYGVTAGPGRNAAWIMLKDFGMNIDEVVAKKEGA
jgi:phytoene dehydrogenase-like protein